MNLTDDEKRAAAMGCRAAAHIARKDAEGASNSSVRAGFEKTAAKYLALAGKFEASCQSTPPAHI